MSQFGTILGVLALAGGVPVGIATHLFLVACSGDGSIPSAPTSAPDLAASISRAAPLDPTHIYRFSLSCSAAAPNSIVSITTNGPINVLCGGVGPSWVRDSCGVHSHSSTTR